MCGGGGSGDLIHTSIKINGLFPATACLRVVMFPIVVKAQKNMVALNQVMPEHQKLQMEPLRPHLSPDQRESHCNQIRKNFLQFDCFFNNLANFLTVWQIYRQFGYFFNHFSHLDLAPGFIFIFIYLFFIFLKVGTPVGCILSIFVSNHTFPHISSVLALQQTAATISNLQMVSLRLEMMNQPSSSSG